MTAYIRVAAAAIAAVIGGFLGAHNRPPTEPAPEAKPAAHSAFYAPQIKCTFTLPQRDVTVFVNVPCNPVPSLFTAADGFVPPTGNPNFGVVCALRDGDTFEIIANTGATKDAGLICDGLINRGWVEDPRLGTDFNSVLGETSNAVG